MTDQEKEYYERMTREAELRAAKHEQRMINDPVYAAQIRLKIACDERGSE